MGAQQPRQMPRILALTMASSLPIVSVYLVLSVAGAAGLTAAAGRGAGAGLLAAGGGSPLKQASWLAASAIDVQSPVWAEAA